MLSQENVIVDFGKGISDTIYARYGESGRVVKFKFINSNISEEPLIGVSQVKFILVKSDRTFVVQDVNVSEGLELTENMCASSGIGFYEMQLVSDDVILSGKGNFIVSDRILTDEIIESVSEVNGLKFPEDFQEKLIAGENITIEGNVISASGNLSMNYNNATNKPQINNVELVGNVTGDDLGLCDASALDDVEEDVATLQSDVTTLQTGLATANGNISNLQGDVSTLQTGLASVNGNITNLQSDVSTLQTGLASANGNISNLQGDVSTLQTGLATANSNISNLQSDVTTLQTGLATANSNISNLQSDVTTLQTGLASANGNITNLQEKVPEMIFNTSISDTQSANLISGKNLDDYDYFIIQYVASSQANYNYYASETISKSNFPTNNILYIHCKTMNDNNPSAVPSTYDHYTRFTFDFINNQITNNGGCRVKNDGTFYGASQIRLTQVLGLKI